MKVAIVSESPADEAAMHRLVSGLLGVAIDVIPVAVRHSSWPRVRMVLPNVIAEVYYHTDAAGIVVVVDSDDSPLHDTRHVANDPANSTCRVCALTNVVVRTTARLAQRPMGNPMQFAIGLAVPAIEAWLLCGIDHQVSEASYVNARRQNTIAYSRPDLKRRLYGTDRPSLDQETAAMIREANRLAAGQMLLLEQLFPLGFGLLATQLRSWQTNPVV